MELLIEIEIPLEQDINQHDAIYFDKWVKRGEKETFFEQGSYMPWENVWRYENSYMIEEDTDQIGMLKKIKYFLECLAKELVVNSRAKIIIKLYVYIYANFYHFEKNFSTNKRLLETMYNKILELSNGNYGICALIQKELTEISTDLIQKFNVLYKKI